MSFKSDLEQKLMKKKVELETKLVEQLINLLDDPQISYSTRAIEYMLQYLKSNK